MCSSMTEGYNRLCTREFCLIDMIYYYYTQYIKDFFSKYIQELPTQIPSRLTGFKYVGASAWKFPHHNDD